MPIYTSDGVIFIVSIESKLNKYLNFESKN